MRLVQLNVHHQSDWWECWSDQIQTHLDKLGMKIEKTIEAKKRSIFQLKVAFIKPIETIQCPYKRVWLNQNENFEEMVYKCVVRQILNILLSGQHGA